MATLLKSAMLPSHPPPSLLYYLAPWTLLIKKKPFRQIKELKKNTGVLAKEYISDAALRLFHMLNVLWNRAEFLRIFLPKQNFVFGLAESFYSM